MNDTTSTPPAGLADGSTTPVDGPQPDIVQPIIAEAPIGQADIGRADIALPGRFRRFVAHPFVLMLIGTAIVVAAWIGTSIGAHFSGLTRGPILLIGAVIVSVVTILAYRGFVRFVERGGDGTLPFASAAASGAGYGTLAGLAIFASAALAVMAFGGLTVAGVSWRIGDLSQMAGIAILAGVTEEILFRGVLFRFIERMGGSIVALIITSGLFGFAHIMNPDATLLAAIAITVEAGLLLAAIYMLTRNLWVAIGLHAGWNFTQGYIFSLPVSGGGAPDGLLLTQRSGPEWLTGGPFGLEASLVTLCVTTAFGLAILWLAVRRGRLVPMRGARAAQDALMAQTKL